MGALTWCYEAFYLLLFTIMRRFIVISYHYDVCFTHDEPDE